MSEDIGHAVTGKDLWRNEEQVWEHEGEYSAELFTKEAQRIIREHNREQV